MVVKELQLLLQAIKLKIDNLSNIQVQADWNEEDETSPAYIHNKPASLGNGTNNVFKIRYVVFNGYKFLVPDDSEVYNPSAESIKANALSQTELLNLHTKGISIIYTPNIGNPYIMWINNNMADSGTITVDGLEIAESIHFSYISFDKVVSEKFYGVVPPVTTLTSTSTSTTTW